MRMLAISGDRRVAVVVPRAGGIRTHDLLNPIQAATVCNSFAEKQLQISLPFQLYQIGRSY
jgi:hypothetical protein